MSAPQPSAAPASANETPGSAAPRRRFRRPIPDEAGVVGVLVLLVAGVGLFEPDFVRTTNLLTTTHNAVYVGLMACGMVFALAMREVDLSVGGMYAMGIVVGALLIRDGVNTWVAALLVLALSALVGAINGVVTTYLRLPSFIVTLATSMLLRGVGLALAEGKQITDLPQDDAFFRVLGGEETLGVPNAVWVFAASVVVLTVLFTRTRFGARVRAIGSNPEAAEFGGLPVTRTRIAALALSGLMAGLAAVLALAFFIAGDPTIGQGYELTAIAAAIIGGTPLKGGSGSVLGAAAGTLILGVVTAALVFFDVPINWTTFATGGVILVAVGAAPLLRRFRDLRPEREPRAGRDPRPARGGRSSGRTP
ncbi:ABC transporter permease [Actinomadura rubrisoli]|uniref:Autoinducer 2 import system permease protein LsrC n=1 Tax=Actinomadura rubrisoli TaxID=2530368 RepID=A0A4R5A4M9_9ACTN|nr:ABC transporter permease [Actinomadura rubrisoli]TDD66948.1 ABC transporter permease [Actinomadura rubrisoli]